MSDTSTFEGYPDDDVLDAAEVTETPVVEPQVIDMSRVSLQENDDEPEITLRERLGIGSIEDLAADTRNPTSKRWLYAPFIENGRQVYLVAERKTGKSILLLEICVEMALGLKPTLGVGPHDRYALDEADPAHVLYIDRENVFDDDIRRRVQLMGYDYDGIDESLFYWSFPNIGALNTPEGARKALRVVRAFDIDLVVVDTISKFITGPEKEADTWNQLYQHFLTPLKEEGVASVLADHPGYGDADRGRGSSSKGGDVDTLWTLKKAKGQKTIGVTDLVLKQQWDRAAGDRVLYVRRTSDPLSHEISLSAPSNGPQRTTQAADGEVSATGLLAANFTEPVGINAGTRYLRAAGVRGSQDNLTAIVRQFNDKLIGAK